MSQTLVALYDTFPEAQTAVQNLINAGIPQDNISLVANKTGSGYNDDQIDGIHQSSPAADAAGRDATKGTVIGGIGGLLVGMGFLAIPGVGPLLAAGPILAALTGAGVGAATGGIIGALTHAGVPKDNADYYAEGIRRGGALVTVLVDDNAVSSTEAILDGQAPVDIQSRGQKYRDTGYTGYNETAPAYTPEQIDNERLTLREERLSATTRNVQAGEVTLRKAVVTEERSIDVPVTHEEVVIERHAVTGRAAVNADFKDETISVPVYDEKVVVEKNAVVTEEISLGKRAVTETQHVTDTVRREEAVVENPGNVDVLNRDDVKK